MKSKSIFSRARSFLLGHPETLSVSQWFGAYDEDTGLQVDAMSSMQVSAVSACVQLLAGSVAQLPSILYQRDDEGNKKRANIPLARILQTKPNRFQTPYEFKEMMMGHALLTGNGYAEIISTGAQAVSELMPLAPARVTPFWTASGERAYRYQDKNGKSRIILQDEMFHLMFFSFDGLIGLDPITMHRRTLGLTIGAEKYGARFYKSDATPPVALVYPGKLKEPARQNIRESWNNKHAGINNSHTAALLEEGMDIKVLTTSPENAQFLQTRKFQVVDIARIYNVQPHMIGAVESSPRANIEQQSLEYVIYTLTPWLTKWEQRMTLSLLDETQQLEYFIEFLVAALLRGDINSRFKAYAVAKQWGWMSTNDILRSENRNTIGDQGDIYLVPVNMVPATTLRNLTKGEIREIRTLALKQLGNGNPNAEKIELFLEEINEDNE